MTTYAFYYNILHEILKKLVSGYFEEAVEKS